MNAQHLHHQHAPNELLCFVESEGFTELQSSVQAIHDEFNWEEFESEYAEESLPNHVLAFIKEAARE